MDEEEVINKSKLFFIVITYIVISWCFLITCTKTPLIWGLATGILNNLAANRIRSNTLLLIMALHGIMAWFVMLQYSQMIGIKNIQDCIPTPFQISLIAGFQITITTASRKIFNLTFRVFLMLVGLLGSIICEVILLIFHFLVLREYDVEKYADLPFYAVTFLIAFYSCAISTF